MTQIGSVYGQGLYALAHEEELEQAIMDELDELRLVFAGNPEFLKLLSSHTLTKQERCSVLDNSLRGRVQPYVLNFLKLLTEKGYIRQFENCCRAYGALYDEQYGILRVEAVSAVDLSGSQREKLRLKLCAMTGKTVVLHCSVDPSCLGGVRLSCAGLQVDGTVRSRLDAISSLLQKTVL